MFLAHHSKVVDHHHEQGKEGKEQEAPAIAMLRREVDEASHQRRKDEATKGPEAAHPAVGTADAQGRIIVKGLEDDTYTLTEVRTDSGYVMLKQGIDVVISQKNTDASCAIYGTDVLGLIQNDPRYASIINDSGDLHNMPQKHLEHKLLTASAAVDSKKVTIGVVAQELTGVLV